MTFKHIVIHIDDGNINKICQIIKEADYMLGRGNWDFQNIIVKDIFKKHRYEHWINYWNTLYSKHMPIYISRSIDKKLHHLENSIEDVNYWLSVLDPNGFRIKDVHIFVQKE